MFEFITGSSAVLHHITTLTRQQFYNQVHREAQSHVPLTHAMTEKPSSVKHCYPPNKLKLPYFSWSETNKGMYEHVWPRQRDPSQVCFELLSCWTTYSQGKPQKQHDDSLGMPISSTGGGSTIVTDASPWSTRWPLLSRCSWQFAHQCRQQWTIQGSHGEFWWKRWDYNYRLSSNFQLTNEDQTE
jgi:hypothetical protein